MKRFLSALVVAGVLFGLLVNLCLPLGGRAAAQADPLLRTAIIGDSLTEGYGASSPSKSYVSLLDATFNTQGRDVEPFGIRGATALRWLNCPLYPTMQGCDRPEYAGQYNHLHNYNPTTVLIALGGNEMIISRNANTYANQMLELARRVYSLVAPGTLIAFVHYYDITNYGYQTPAIGTLCDFPGQCNGITSKPAWSQYDTALKAIAAPNGIAYIDISSMLLTKNADFISDHLHLNDSGNAIFYNKLNDFLQQAVPVSQYTQSAKKL